MFFTTPTTFWLWPSKVAYVKHDVLPKCRLWRLVFWGRLGIWILDSSISAITLLQYNRHFTYANISCALIQRLEITAFSALVPCCYFWPPTSATSYDVDLGLMDHGGAENGRLDGLCSLGSRERPENDAAWVGHQHHQSRGSQGIVSEYRSAGKPELDVLRWKGMASLPLVPECTTSGGQLWLDWLGSRKICPDLLYSQGPAEEWGVGPDWAQKPRGSIQPLLFQQTAVSLGLWR